jgi:hypothetical protein
LQDWFIFKRSWLPSNLIPIGSKIDSLSPYAIYIAGGIKTLDLAVDLGPSLGRSQILSKEIFFSIESNWNGSGFDQKILEGSILNLGLHFDGRLSGNIVLDSLTASCSVFDPNDLSLHESSMKSVINLAKLTSEFSQLYERLFILQVLSLRIAHTNHPIASKLELLLNVLSEELSFSMSKSAIPVINQFINRVAAAFEEKRRQASQAFLEQKEKDAKSTLLNNRSKLTIENANVTLKFSFASPLVIGTFMAENYSDPVCLQLYIHGLKINGQELDTTSLDRVKENCEIELESLKLQLTQLKPVTHAEEKMMSISQWLTFLNVYNGIDLLQMKKTYLQLLTDLLPENIIEYSLDARFTETVDITLNLAHYAFLDDLIRSYVNYRTPETRELELLDFRKSPNRKFIKTGISEFSPRLNVIGEATPNGLLEKFGFSEDLIPMTIYQGLNEPIWWANHLFGEYYKKVAISKRDEEFHSPTREDFHWPEEH